MKRRSVVLLLLIAAFVSFTIIKCLQDRKRAEIYSEIMSITTALVSELQKENATLREVFSFRTEEWQFLTAEEYDKVTFEIDRHHNIDVPKNRRPPSYLVDFWGNRYVIAYRELPNQILDVIVVSKGRDGIYGTEDDIVDPRESAPPKRPSN